MDKGTEQKRINKETRKVVFTKSSSHVRDGSGQQNPDPPLAENGKVARNGHHLTNSALILSPLSTSVPF